MYLMSIEGMGDGSGNFCSYFAPIITIYDSLEKLYKDFNNECKHNDEEINRIKFVELFNKGGIIFNEYSWIKLMKIQLNKSISLGCRYERENLKPNDPISYKDKEYEILEKHEDAKQCPYQDLDLDGKEFICSEKTSKNGYCFEHNQIREELMNEIEERFRMVAEKLKQSEDQHEEFITYWENIEDNNYTPENLRYVKKWEIKLGFNYLEYKALRAEIKLITKDNLDLVPLLVLKLCDLNLSKNRYLEDIEKDHTLAHYIKGDLIIFYLYDCLNFNYLRVNTFEKIIALRNDKIIYINTRKGYLSDPKFEIVGYDSEVQEILRLQNIIA